MSLFYYFLFYQNKNIPIFAGVSDIEMIDELSDIVNMEQIKKQADRIAKLFGFDKHWTT